jgi:hypothetical protein
MKKFGTKSFKACGCGKKSCKICTIPDNATKLIFHTANKIKRTLKPTKKQLEVMKLFWAMLQQEEIRFSARVFEMEKAMSKNVGIHNLIFFLSDDGYCGIGNESRTMKLIHQEELEKR